MKCPKCNEEIAKFSDICPKCKIDIFEYKKNITEKDNKDMGREKFSSTKTTSLKWINILQLFGFLVASFISFSMEGNKLQGIIYLAIGLIIFAFIKGFSDIIDLLDEINNKIK